MNVGIISTSANPLHAGHLAMAEWGDKNGYNVVFEIPSVNADKGKISQDELDKRMAQCYNIRRPVISTEEPSFFNKEFKVMHQLYKIICGRVYGDPINLSFFVGYDTIIRIDDVKYYYGSSYERDRLIGMFDSKFVVFERNGMSDLSVLSPKLREICTLASDYTPLNISSTELRNVQQAI